MSNSEPALRAGDRVRLVSPASFPSEELLAETVQVLEGWDLAVEIGEHAQAQWGYMAGRDEDRLADLNDAYRDPGVRAIFATRGGAGAYRIADDLDFDLIRNDPKPLVGFSDITNLHLATWNQCRAGGVHGCLIGERASSSARRLLMNGESVTLRRDPEAMSSSVDVGGRVEGPLIGGNLREVAGAIGTRLGGLDGAILFLEEFRMIGLGQIDRQLTQLIRSGSLDGVVGLALGLFTGFDDYTDGGWTLVDVLNDRLTDLGIPVLGGLDVGHGGTGADGGPDQTCLPIGGTATLDATNGTITASPFVGTRGA